MNRIRQHLRSKSFRDADSERYIGVLAHSIARPSIVLLRSKRIIGIVPPNFSSPIRHNRAYVHNSRGLSRRCAAENRRFEESHEEKVSEMIGAQLGFETFFGSDDVWSPSNCCVVYDDLEAK